MVKIQPYETKKLFVTVKTYPTPSTTYIETTCVSGITDDGHWIRIHPVRFRALEEDNQFQRYSWIQVRANKATRDPRPESYHVDEETIQFQSRLLTANAWQERREIVEPMLSQSVEDLRDQQANYHTSLGVIRPKEITSFSIEKADKDWSPKQLAKLDQQDLFALKQGTRLEKIPFDFYYDFICDDPRCHGHHMKVLDWEVAQSYRKWSRRVTQDEWEKKMKEMYDDRVRHSFDSLFFLGTLAKYPTTWTIGGIFFAPKKRSEILQQHKHPETHQPTLW